MNNFFDEVRHWATERALSPRESEVVFLVAEGMKNREIAEALSITEGTVKVYLSRLFSKLQVGDRFELALLVMNAVERTAQPEPSSLPQPPLNSQFLLDIFLPESRCEEFLGDLLERYNKKLPRLGKARADWWYRKQVLTSLWPLFTALLKRSSKGSLARVVCFTLRLFGLPSWADGLAQIVDEERKRGV